MNRLALLMLAVGCTSRPLVAGDDLFGVPEGATLFVELATASAKVDTHGVDIVATTSGTTLTLQPQCDVVHGLGRPVLAPVTISADGRSDQIMLLVSPSYDGPCTPVFTVTYDTSGDAVGDLITDPASGTWVAPPPFTITVDDHDAEATLDVHVETDAPATFLQFMAAGEAAHGAVTTVDIGVRGEFVVTYWATEPGEIDRQTMPESFAVIVGALPSVGIELLTPGVQAVEFEESTLRYRVWARGVTTATVDLARTNIPVVRDPDVTRGKPLLHLADETGEVTCGDLSVDDPRPSIEVATFPRTLTLTVAPSIDAAPALQLGARVSSTTAPAFDRVDQIPVANRADFFRVNYEAGSVACVNGPSATAGAALIMAKLGAPTSGDAGHYLQLPLAGVSVLSATDTALSSASTKQLGAVLMAEGASPVVLGELCDNSSCEIDRLDVAAIPTWSAALTFQGAPPPALANVRVVARLMIGGLLTAPLLAYFNGDNLQLLNLVTANDRTVALPAMTGRHIIVVDLGLDANADPDIIVTGRSAATPQAAQAVFVDVKPNGLTADPPTQIDDRALGIGVGYDANHALLILENLTGTLLQVDIKQAAIPPVDNPHVVLAPVIQLARITLPGGGSRVLATVRGVGTYELDLVTPQVTTFAQRDPVLLQSTRAGTTRVDPGGKYGSKVAWCPDARSFVVVRDSDPTSTGLRWSESPVAGLPVAGPWAEPQCQR